MKLRRLLLLLALFAVARPDPAAAQDVLAQARGAATRADGIAVLERHLAATPGDVDARLLYGLMLSWEKRYDEARRQLEQVLAAVPDYIDARVGLMNVEWWTGNADAARRHSDDILLREPGHAQARLVRQRLDASDRPWSFGIAASHDRFSDAARTPWNEQLVTLSRQTTPGAVVVRGSRAARFGLVDEQVEFEFYPMFRPGTYAFIGVGFSPDHALYPENRLAFDLYHGVGGGFELSAGYRRLAFAETTKIYVASVTKYAGAWMLTAKASHVPGGSELDATSGQLTVRRYFGRDGTSFAGGVYSHGLSRDEVRGAGDLLTLDSDTIRAQVDALVSGRLRLQFDAGSSRQERSATSVVWQHSAAAGFAVRF